LSSPVVSGSERVTASFDRVVLLSIYTSNGAPRNRHAVPRSFFDTLKATRDNILVTQRLRHTGSRSPESRRRGNSAAHHREDVAVRILEPRGFGFSRDMHVSLSSHPGKVIVLECNSFGLEILHRA